MLLSNIVKLKSNLVTKNIVVNDLGKKIKTARKAQGLSLQILGERIGRTHSALSQIETGKKQPEKTTLILLAKELNDDFGEPDLAKHLTGENRPSREEIISGASAEEIWTLKFNGGGGKYSKAEMLKLKMLMDKELEEIDKRNAIRKANE